MRNAALITDGVLQRYILGSYSARKLGLATTGNAGGVHNLKVAANAGDLSSIARQMGEGLLVTELMGQGVNGVTGDYSRGAAGFVSKWLPARRLVWNLLQIADGRVVVDAWTGQAEAEKAAAEALLEKMK